MWRTKHPITVKVIVIKETIHVKIFPITTCEIHTAVIVAPFEMFEVIVVKTEVVVLFIVAVVVELVLTGIPVMVMVTVVIKSLTRA